MITDPREAALRVPVLLALPLFLSACGSSIISVDGRLKSDREVPYDRAMLLTKVDDNSIATISDDPRGTVDHYLNLYDDTLGLRWSTFIPVDRAHVIEPIWLARSSDGITLVYQRNEEGDSSTIAGTIFDRTTGKEKKSVDLSGISFDMPDTTALRRPRLVFSPDSSKFLIYRVDEFELKEHSENESLTVHADVFDRDLNRIATGTLRTKMDRNVEGRAEETTGLTTIMLGNNGKVYQVTRHGPTTIQMLEWDVAPDNRQAVRWAISADELKTDNIEIRQIKAHITPTNTIFIAAALRMKSASTKVELAGMAIGGFNTAQQTPLFTGFYNLNDESIRHMTFDQLKHYVITDLIIEPTTGTILLPLQHIYVLEHRDRYDYSQWYYVNGNLLALAFDRQGKPQWAHFVQIPWMTLTHPYLTCWWKVDPKEAHFVYRNNDDDAIIVGRLSTTTGKALPSITIANTDMTPWFGTSTWLEGNNGIIKLGLGRDAHLVRIAY